MEVSCTPDRNCHTFCLGDKIASHPGVLTQARKNTQNLEINQILGFVVQEKESNMVFCSRWKFPTQGMTVLSGTEAPPSGINLRSQVSVYRTIGPLVFSGFSCFRPPTDWSISHELK